MIRLWSTATASSLWNLTAFFYSDDAAFLFGDRLTAVTIQGGGRLARLLGNPPRTFATDFPLTL